VIEAFWDSVDGKLHYIDVGRDGVVWGTNGAKSIFYRQGVTAKTTAGTKWVETNGKGTFIANCPTGMSFVVGPSSKLWFRTGTTDENFIGSNWAKVSEDASITSISCGRGGFFVALIAGVPYGRIGVDVDVPQGTSWEKLTHMARPKMTTIAIGEDGDVWASFDNDKHEVIRATGIDDKFEIYGKAAVSVYGKEMDQVNIGRGQVWGVDKYKEIYRRKFTAANPDGVEWEQIPGSMRWVSTAEEGIVWALDDEDDIWIWEEGKISVEEIVRNEKVGFKKV